MRGLRASCLPRCAHAAVGFPSGGLCAWRLPPCVPWTARVLSVCGDSGRLETGCVLPRRVPFTGVYCFRAPCGRGGFAAAESPRVALCSCVWPPCVLASRGRTAMVCIRCGRPDDASRAAAVGTGHTKGMRAGALRACGVHARVLFRSRSLISCGQGSARFRAWAIRPSGVRSLAVRSSGVRTRCGRAGVGSPHQRSVLACGFGRRKTLSRNRTGDLRLRSLAP